MAYRHIQEILVLDDEKSYADMLSFILEKEGYRTITFYEPKKALEHLRHNVVDLIVSDISMPEVDGVEFLRRFMGYGLETPVIMISAYGTIDSAVGAMKLGAYDYISKPFKPDELLLVINKLEDKVRLEEDNRSLRAEVEEKYVFSKIIARSRKMLELFETIKKIVPYKSTVLLSGESGTGKELFARAIHYNSPRTKRKLVSVNCGAIPENLLESELFGHARGAFTGAMKEKMGLFEDADGGTIFLDEIAELPTNLQVKLLRVLQEEEIRRVGETATRPIDTRVVAATARNLTKEQEEGRFREDLYYRLNVIHLVIPPLRERTDDIPLLVSHFLGRFHSKYDESEDERERPVLKVSNKVMKVLMEYPWPGNVRELENTMERAFILTEGDTITEEILPDKFFAPKSRIFASFDENDLSIKRTSKVMEEQLIRRALQRTRGNKSQAARLLEISHKALLYKVKDYKIKESF
jgi:two-component system, NtrC family, response regulator AtoC